MSIEISHIFSVQRKEKNEEEEKTNMSRDAPAMLDARERELLAFIVGAALKNSE